MDLQVGVLFLTPEEAYHQGEVVPKVAGKEEVVPHELPGMESHLSKT